MHIRFVAFMVSNFAITTLAYADSSSWASSLSTLVQTTESLPLRLLLVAGLGMLLSLTPCIYPMIPITVGILQAQGSNSILRNFCLAVSYTLGIASTFALLGVSAAYTGQLVGSFMTKPLVIIPLVTLLAYLAGSMMGFYEMYTPRFLQQNSTTGGGSLVSAFFFGAASGTVASPCLSPGLILLLTIVTSMGNVLLGFMLLFAFGIGLSIPLLAIGTFSSTLALLPRAGMWMVEVKKIFGLIMIGMCFYFLQPLLAPHIFAICVRATLLILAGYYIHVAHTTYCISWKATKYVVATGLVLAAWTGGTVFDTAHAHKTDCSAISWHTDYQAAHAYALQEHKLLFVDVTADYCSLCTAIEKKLFFDTSVVHALGAYVPVKINASDAQHTVHQNLLRTYRVMGTPTFLLIDPETNALVTQFGSELHESSGQEFIQLLDSYAR